METTVTPPGASLHGARDADPLRGALMVCGTTSNAGKSTLVAALCRVFARSGVRVAPFKAQNMALNSVVTVTGAEIGRAQEVQAFAARVEPEAAMNPVLLKPTGERTSQVIVMGRPVSSMTAAEYHAHKPELLPVVLDALADLRSRFDVVLCEGAGSPTEINLLDHDIVNLRVAREAGIPAIVIGDIEPGGVFAALYGTVALLPDDLRAHVRAFVINKFRGDPALLFDGSAELEARTGVPTLGVLPWFDGGGFDAEDSLVLDTSPRHTLPEAAGDELDVAVMRFPRLSNFTDLDPLWCEPGVSVRFVADVASLGRPDLVVLGGTKATVDDLAWLRARGLDEAIGRTSATVLGICGGYQMLGRVIDDGVESRVGRVDGLDLLPVSTVFAQDKVTERCHGRALRRDVHGYRIHHGRVRVEGGTPFVTVQRGERDDVDGVQHGRVFGTTLHGIFEDDGFRHAFLDEVATARGKRFVDRGISFAAGREARVDAVADLVASHLDMGAIVDLVATGAPAATVSHRR
jgi:adenosylcobyric acid synthase